MLVFYFLIDDVSRHQLLHTSSSSSWMWKTFLNFMYLISELVEFRRVHEDVLQRFQSNLSFCLFSDVYIKYCES